MIAARVLADSTDGEVTKRSAWPRGRHCNQCGGAFLAQSTHPRQRYCGLSCAASGRSNLPIRPCPMCEAPFRPYKSRQRYCQVACSNRARSAA